MYNLLECSENCRKTTGSLWNYYKDEPSNPISSNSDFLHKRQVLQKILTMVTMVKRDMIQTELVKMKLELLYH